MCADQYLENLAFRRPTWLSASWGGYTAEKAVDGRKANSHYANGPCTVSPDIQEVTWRVDLQRIRKVEYIRIYFRTDNRPFDRNNHLAGFPLGFSVYISNTTNKNDGVLCYHDSNYTKGTIPETATTPCSYSGQYIIYYNERVRGRNYPSDYYRYARADLCEVEVYGCSVPVESLLECRLPCPENCKCHVGTGVCRSCYDGYEGVNCEQKQIPLPTNCDDLFH
uniref:Uncharacterized protein LOC111110994 n=1 Tax=Crassostrea virginica TaxID=6565 RepID=A0A8B8BKM6_CRAVI|nr:uncharacterized protein LOC111110994 [Crassostrea virginica]